MTYQPVYMPRFKKRLQTYHSLQSRIEKVALGVVADPYARTERLTYKHGFNLKDCRSAHVGMNFRILFVICEECRNEPECEYCFCVGLPDQTVVFLTVGPHDKAYALK